MTPTRAVRDLIFSSRIAAGVRLVACIGQYYCSWPLAPAPAGKDSASLYSENMRFFRLIGIVALLPCLAYEQDTVSSSRNGTQSPPSPTVVRIGPGVTPPRLRSEVEPTYSAQALTELVQGTVVLDAVIDDQGLPRKNHGSESLGVRSGRERRTGGWKVALLRRRKGGTRGERPGHS